MPGIQRAGVTVTVLVSLTVLMLGSAGFITEAFAGAAASFGSATRRRAEIHSGGDLPGRRHRVLAALRAGVGWYLSPAAAWTAVGITLIVWLQCHNRSSGSRKNAAA